MSSQKTEMVVVMDRSLEMIVRMRETSDATLHKVAKDMEDDAKSRLHPGSFGYETGKARDSIHGTVEDDSVVLSGGGDEAPYFPYNEFGTRHRAAAPALQPAFEKHKGDYETEMQITWMRMK